MNTRLLIMRAGENEPISTSVHSGRGAAVRYMCSFLLAAFPPHMHMQLVKTPLGCDVYVVFSKPQKKRQPPKLIHHIVYNCVLTQDDNTEHVLRELQDSYSRQNPN